MQLLVVVAAAAKAATETPGKDDGSNTDNKGETARSTQDTLTKEGNSAAALESASKKADEKMSEEREAKEEAQRAAAAAEAELKALAVHPKGGLVCVLGLRKNSEYNKLVATVRTHREYFRHMLSEYFDLLFCSRETVHIVCSACHER